MPPTDSLFEKQLASYMKERGIKVDIIIENLTIEILETMIRRSKKIGKALDINLSLEEYLRLVIVMNRENYTIEVDTFQRNR